MTDPGSVDAAATVVAAAYAAIDAANAEDPTRFVRDGVERPLAQLQGELATAWLERLDPDAGPALRIAARAHHLRRFALPRSSYPEGRSGYLVWRRDQKRAHAAALRELLTPIGIDPEVIERAGVIVQRSASEPTPRCRPSKTPSASCSSRRSTTTCSPVVARSSSSTRC